MKSQTDECRVCNRPLESPFAKNRGAHKACLDVEKSDGDSGYVEK